MSMVHLPAVNTPQFDWCETTLDKHPQPVPPIYQPEIPARIIVDVALNGERERVVGSWNRLLVLGGRLFPGFGNEYAARGAWESQLTSQPIDPHRPSNLRRPIDSSEDHGAHGMFDDKAGGFLSPSFLKALPQTAKTFLDALKATMRHKAQVAGKKKSQLGRGVMPREIGRRAVEVASPGKWSSSDPSA
jgi:hypothetical protein